MMNTRSILLAYASRYGSTQEVAEVIATELRAGGLAVDIQLASEVKNIESYDAVVLGAAIYNTRWHPEAHQFLAQHEQMLPQRPIAIFALGPLSTSSAAMRNSRRQLDMELAKYPWLKPVALEMFVGKIDPAKLSFIDRLGVTASDRRDWDAIRSWAGSLAAQLRPSMRIQTAA